jgi:hypothetical protein
MIYSTDQYYFQFWTFITVYCRLFVHVIMISSCPSSPSGCIPANPDISGVGVRTAIYAQSFLAFAPIISSIWDWVVTSDEVDSVQDQSVGILSIAFALLFSTIVQARTQDLSSFHAAVVLNLSWMNNTSTFLWFLLFALSRSNLKAAKDPIPATWRGWTKAMMPSLPNDRREFRKLGGDDVLSSDEVPDDVQVEIEGKQVKVSRAGYNGDSEAAGLHHTSPDGGKQRHGALAVMIWFGRLSRKYIVLVLGSLHLSLMATVGIWLWSKPSSFERVRHASCAPSLAIVGSAVPFSSPALRLISLTLYSAVLIPGLNLIIPFAVFLTPHILWNNLQNRSSRAKRYSGTQAASSSIPGPPEPIEGKSSEIDPTFLYAGFLFLLAINIIFVIDIEVTLSRNSYLQTPGEGDWGFGQVLALLLLVVPFRDFLSSLSKIRDGERKLKALRERRRAQERFVDMLSRAIRAESTSPTPPRPDNAEPQQDSKSWDFKQLILEGADPYTEISLKPGFPSEIISLGCDSLMRLAMYCGDTHLVQWLFQNFVYTDVAHGE